jgi:hypothetical protein
LSRDALDDMRMIAGDFPVVTPDGTGRAALRRWVRRFCEVYATHATIIRILSQAEVVGEDVWADGMQVLFRLAEAITQGVAAGRGRQVPRASGSGSPRQEELTALACLLMLERVNYLFTVGVQLSRAEMADRLSDIIFAAFHAPRRPAPAQRASARHQAAAT